MNFLTDDPLAALLALALLIVVLWIVAYTAGRVALASGVVAVDQAFAAVAEADGDAIRITVHLLGTRPAMDVAMAWQGDPVAPLASARLLTPVRPLVAVVPSTSLPLDVGPGGVGLLEVQWRPTAEQGTALRVAVVPVQLPGHSA